MEQYFYNQQQPPQPKDYGFYNDDDDDDDNEDDIKNKKNSNNNSDEENEDSNSDNSSSFEYDDEDDEDDEDNTPKLSFGAMFLAKQGYVQGEGLGKDKSGRVDIIQVDKIQSTKGLGFENKKLPDFYAPQKHELEDSDLDFPHKQSIDWISSFKKEEENNSEMILFDSELFDLKLGNPEIDKHRRGHCSIEMMLELDQHKTALDHLEKKLFLYARKKSNPYETIKGSIFINRAAVKMANLDKLANLLIPLKPIEGKPSEFLYFADVCAGPGGFTEYVYWKKTKGKLLSNDNQHHQQHYQQQHQQHQQYQHYQQQQQQQQQRFQDQDQQSILDLDDIVKGFGFTIRGKCDWNIEKFSKQIPIYNFKKEYGFDGTGNILVSRNIQNFSQNVFKYTSGNGLHLFMADGGISTEGKENQQELILSQLILCQILTMFETLGQGGNFVCKIFDTYTPFTISLLYLVYKHFDQFSICKPYTSRPLNSERYIIAKNYRSYRPEKVLQVLYDINEKLNNKQMVLEIIPISKMDQEFLTYIYDRNSDICSRQIKAFNLFKKYIEDQDLPTCDQYDIRNKCLEEWGLPKETKFDLEHQQNKKFIKQQQQQQQQLNNMNRMNQNYQNRKLNNNNNGNNNNNNNNYNNGNRNGSNNSSGNNSNLTSPNNSSPNSPMSPQFNSTSPNNNSFNKGRRFINNKQLVKTNSQFHNKPPPPTKNHLSPLQIQQQFLLQQQREQNLLEQHQLQSTSSDILAANFMENLLKRMQETRINNNNNDSNNL